MEKSRVVSIFSIRNFKFLGFALGKGRKGVYVRAHAKSLKKAKAKLKEPDEIGNAAVAGPQKRELTKGVLGNCRKRYSYKDHYEQETRRSRIL